MAFVVVAVETTLWQMIQITGHTGKPNSSICLKVDTAEMTED